MSAIQSTGVVCRQPAQSLASDVLAASLTNPTFATSDAPQATLGGNDEAKRQRDPNPHKIPTTPDEIMKMAKRCAIAALKRNPRVVGLPSDTELFEEYTAAAALSICELIAKYDPAVSPVNPLVYLYENTILSLRTKLTKESIEAASHVSIDQHTDCHDDSLAEQIQSRDSGRSGNDNLYVSPQEQSGTLDSAIAQLDKDYPVRGYVVRAVLSGQQPDWISDQLGCDKPNISYLIRAGVATIGHYINGGPLPKFSRKEKIPNESFTVPEWIRENESGPCPYGVPFRASARQGKAWAVRSLERVAKDVFNVEQVKTKCVDCGVDVNVRAKLRYCRPCYHKYLLSLESPDKRFEARYKVKPSNGAVREGLRLSIEGRTKAAKAAKAANAAKAGAVV